MHPTFNPMAEDKRSKSVSILQPILADSTNLYLRAKQAHWNIKGEDFIALHELLDKVSDLALEGEDKFAERIVQLGGQALGTLEAAVKNTTLQPFPEDISAQQYLMEEVRGSLASISKNLSKAFVDLTAIGDNVSANIVLDANQSIDKYLWFIESNME